MPNQSAELWSFTPDATGRGSWDFIEPADSSIVQSAFTSWTTGNGSVYFLGGTQDFHSSPYLYDLGSEDRQSADGLVTYNMETRTWLNQSITDPYPNGWIWGSQLYYLTGFGNQDLLLSMGGNTSPPGETAGDESFVPYDTVAIYNVSFLPNSAQSDVCLSRHISKHKSWRDVQATLCKVLTRPRLSPTNGATRPQQVGIFPLVEGHPARWARGVITIHSNSVHSCS